jgi:flagellar biosynthesis/type III secretory pathway protein FliH
LYEQGYERQDILNLFRFIDWVITLPQDLEARFRQELEQYEREAQMPYVTSIEQMAKQEGMQEGRREGLREGLISGIELALELKFGSEGAQVLPEIAQIKDVDTLKAIQSGLRQVSTLAELRSIYQP